MSSTQQLILGEGAGGAPAAYQIQRSLRFNSADSAYLSRTPASASNRKTWTWSGWVKRSGLSASTQGLFARNDGSVASYIVWNSNEKLEFASASGSVEAQVITTPVYRDVSSWYHVVVALDTTQATSSNRLKIYVNGVQVTALDTASYPSQNYDAYVNTTNTHYIGNGNPGGSLGWYSNQYLTEVHFIDGSTPTTTTRTVGGVTETVLTQFGQFNSSTGVWEPIAYTGTYGTNGFYLNFSDNSNTTSTTLGKDYSGNGNNWTPSAGFSVAAGAGNDSLVDTPTSYGTDTGVGGEVRGNYATLNPLRSKNSPTFSQGNMRVTDASSSFGVTITTIPPVAGDKIYGEATVASNTSGSSVIGFGFTDVASGATLPDPGNANAYMFYGNANGNIYNGTSLVTSGLGAPTAGTVLQVAYDKSNGYAWVGKANTWYDSSGGTTGNPAAGTNPTFTLTSSNLNFYVLAYNNSLDINFGQRPFAHTAPSGFKALCTQNLPTPTIGATSTTTANKYFDILLWSGTGGARTLSGLGFQPDWVWGKGRSGSATYPHLIWDVLRGTNLNLVTNTNDAEFNAATSSSNGGLGTSTSDGFTIVAGTSTADNLNASSPASTYVGWAWKANGAGSSNTAGSITSTVSANTTAGFSIVTYTGNATAGATVGHGCLVNNVATAPSMIIVKDRVATSGAREWVVYHSSLGNTQAVFLSTTGAAYTGTNLWNNTSPTSTVFTVGNSSEGTNGSGNAMLAYCFAAVAGYSAFGSYTGNGVSNGPFIYTGFRPRYVMIKNSSNGSAPWYVLDTARSPYNEAVLSLNPNSSAAEVTDINFLDINSNGFKVRTDGSYVNGNTNTIIYAAFAEFPFKYTLAR